MSTLSLNRFSSRFSSALSAPKEKEHNEDVKGMHLIETAAPAPLPMVVAVDELVKFVDNPDVISLKQESEDMNQIEELKAKQAKQKEELEATENAIQELEQAARNAGLATIKELIAQWSVEPSEVFNAPVYRATSAPKVATSGKGGKGVLRGPAAVKYRDAATGSAWTGRGQTPTWLKNAIAEGKAKESFAV